MLEIIEKFSQKRVLVIGDLMVDRYYEGKVVRISPEAPTPVFKIDTVRDVLGGAANVAANINALGAKVSVCGVVGDDGAKDFLFKEFRVNGIGYDGVFVDEGRKTTLKQRCLSGHYQVIRLDFEDVSKISSEAEESVKGYFGSSLEEFDAVVISDYAKGCITESLMNFLKGRCGDLGIPIFVDGKPVNKEYYKGVLLIKPNLKEAIEMSGINKDVKEIAKKLSDYFDANVVVTLGKEGMFVQEKGRDGYYVKTTPRFVFDVTGAGDSVMSALVLALSSGSSFREAAELANIVGGLVVQKIGTSVVTLSELKNKINNSKKIVPKVWGEEEWIVNNEKYCGKILRLKKGYFSSYHFHKTKEETFNVLKGLVRFKLEDDELVLGPGDSIHIKPGQKHMFEGLEDSEIMEVSTTHLEEDVVRLTQSGFY
jgi:D-beta-D-heptose 7-phosphate kinase/D-beta-D-heptose 1-phosphate adenosyltransferase